jgi:triacylglycerol lipase
MLGLLALWAAIALGGLMLAELPAQAQIANLPQDVQRKIAALGPVLNPEMIGATFGAIRPLVKQVSQQGIKVVTDVHYGPDPRHLLDISVLEGSSGAKPVLIYIHGGGYVAGNKNNDGIYANVAAFFARHGVLALNATYRLAPKDPWPAGAEDVGRVVAWAKGHAAEYGGNPERIVVFGHSAGATHVATYVFDPTLHPAAGAGVAGAVLVSGDFLVTKDRLAEPNVVAYFGNDESKFAERSAFTHVGQSKVPLFLAVAEFDPPFLFTPTMDIAAAVCRRDGKCPRLIWLKGHNHISEMASFDTADRELGDAILDWMAGLK